MVISSWRPREEARARAVDRFVSAPDRVQDQEDRSPCQAVLQVRKTDRSFEQDTRSLEEKVRWEIKPSRISNHPRLRDRAADRCSNRTVRGEDRAVRRQGHPDRSSNQTSRSYNHAGCLPEPLERSGIGQGGQAHERSDPAHAVDCTWPDYQTHPSTCGSVEPQAVRSRRQIGYFLSRLGLRRLCHVVDQPPSA